MYAVGLKSKFGYDDSLDVVGVHLVGGVVGTLLIGFLASESMPNAINGLFYGGGFDQLWRQAVAAGAVMVYSFVVAFIIAFAHQEDDGHPHLAPRKRKRASTRRSTAKRRTSSPDSLTQTSGRAGATRPRRPVWSASCFLS